MLFVPGSQIRISVEVPAAIAVWASSTLPGVVQRIRSLQRC
jgi:hypothetical protein